MMTCPSDPGLRDVPAIRYGACFRYSPCGMSVSARRSRRYCARLKARDTGFLAHCARRVHRDVTAGGVLADFFGAAPALVPVPSSMRTLPGSLTAAGALAEALLSEGLGSTVWPGLARRHTVMRSSRATPGCRTSAQEQFRSLAVEPVSGGLADILLVDDIVSRGRTLIVAALRLREAFPSARIAGFALMRTTSLVADIETVMDPCAGQIRWVRGDARRNP